MAAEWNEWDLESRVRYKAQRDALIQKGEVDADGNKPLPMHLRLFAKDQYRGGMPRPMDLAFMRLEQKMPAHIHFEEHCAGDDLTNLDLGLMLKYVDRHTIPHFATLLDSLFLSHHIMDDYSCGHYLIYCRWLLSHLKATGGNGFGAEYGNMLACWERMKQREGGSRCTLAAFAHENAIKACVPAGDLPRCLALKHEMLERGVQPTAAAWEGVLECCADVGDAAVAWAEWREMRERHGLAPTERCAVHMLRVCALRPGGLEEGKAIWTEMAETLSLQPSTDAYAALFDLCARNRCVRTAFYHWHELLEYSPHRPDLSVCNALLRVCAACGDLHRAHTVAAHIADHIAGGDDATFRALLATAGAAEDAAQLDAWWAEMQHARVRPSLATLHAYLAALTALPDAPEQPHPAERMARGLAAYDWAGRAMVFSPGTFLLLLHLCARAGEAPTARVLLRKMVSTGIPHTAAHIAATLAAVAASEEAHRPLATASELVNFTLPDTADAATGAASVADAVAVLVTAHRAAIVAECGGEVAAEAALAALRADVRRVAAAAGADDAAAPGAALLHAPAA